MRPSRSSVLSIAFAFALARCTVSTAIDGGDAQPETTPSDDVIDDLGSVDASCPAGTTLCDGYCVDLQTDPTHCGSCGLDCTQLAGVSPNIECTAGRCAFATGCAPGRAHCSTDSVTGCETDVSTAAHCGACGVACSGATPICTPLSDPTMFECTGGCSGGQTLCGSTCVNVLTSVANCGSCGRACGTYETCTSGSCVPACPPMRPVAALPLSSIRSNVCSPSAILVRDGMNTGLDFGSGQLTATLDGQRITSCVAGDFGGPFHFGSVTVRARPVASACSTPCSTLNCNTGDVMAVFAGATTATATLLETVTMRAGSGLTDYRVGSNFDARYVIVCRTGQSYTRDDIAVDAIEASCSAL